MSHVEKHCHVRHVVSGILTPVAIRSYNNSNIQQRCTLRASSHAVQHVEDTRHKPKKNPDTANTGNHRTLYLCYTTY